LLGVVAGERRWSAAGGRERLRRHLQARFLRRHRLDSTQQATTHTASRARPRTQLRGERTKVCRYNWHSVGSLGWLFLVLQYKYIFK